MDFLKKNKKREIVLPKADPNVSREEEYGLKARIKDWVAKYRIQVYLLTIVTIVGILVYLAVGLTKEIVEKANENFAGLTAPSFPASDVTVTEYDLGGVVWGESANKAYRFETDFVNKVTAAAGRIGISSPPQENSYGEYLSWSNTDSQLKYYYNLQKVDFEGSSSLVWVSEADIKSGIQALFEINAENYILGRSSSDERIVTWSFEYQIDGSTIFFGADTSALSVTTTVDGELMSFSLIIVEIIDTKGVKVLEEKDIAEAITTLSKRIFAELYAGGDLGSEDAATPISFPVGDFTGENADYCLYKNQYRGVFATPALCLKGTLTTAEGNSGSATILIDIVDWDKV